MLIAVLRGCFDFPNRILNLHLYSVPSLQLYLTTNHFLDQTSKLLVRRWDTNSFLDFVKLATVVNLQIVKPHAEAVYTVIWHVGQPQILIVSVRHRKHKHVLTDVDLSIQQLLYRVYRLRGLLFKILGGVIVNLFRVDSVWETEIRDDFYWVWAEYFIS